jgi:hypothetical protein
MGAFTGKSEHPGNSRHAPGEFRSDFSLEFDSFDLIERNLVFCSIVELRRPWRLMRRNLLRVFECSAVLKISGNTSRAESMAAGGVGQGGLPGAPLDHVENVAPCDGVVGQFVSLANAPKQWTFVVLANAGSLNPGVQVFVQRVMTGHLVPPAALFVKPEPGASALLKIIPNPQDGGRGRYAV